MEERGDGGRHNPPAKRLRGWSGGVNIARLLPNPAWAIVLPPFLDVIKDFSHTTKRAEGTNALAPSPPVGEAMTRRLGRRCGENTGQIRKYVNSINITEGLEGGGGGGGEVCAQIFRPRREVAEKELGHASSRYCSAFIGN